MNKLFPMIMLPCLSLVGCSAPPPPADGQGEYFELSRLHVVERDLSAFRPTPISTTALDARAHTKAKPTAKTAAPLTQFQLRKGENYQTTIRRWAKEQGYKNTVWSLSDEHLAALNQVSDESLVYKGSMQRAFSLLSKKLETPLRVTSAQKEVLGIYDFNPTPRIVHLSGETLKEVAQGVVEAYGYLWMEPKGQNQQARSWKVPNYEFGSDYYLLTQEHDIQTALETLLEGFPVRSEIVESTGLVTFMEEH